MTNTRMTDPEVLELRYPVRLEEFASAAAPAAPGEWRGGDGARRRIRFLRPMQAVVVASRRNVAPHGLQGGADGAPGRQWVERADGRVEPIPGNAGAADLAAGDALVRGDARAAAAGAPPEAAGAVESAALAAPAGLARPGAARRRRSGSVPRLIDWEAWRADLAEVASGAARAAGDPGRADRARAAAAARGWKRARSRSGDDGDGVTVGRARACGCGSTSARCSPAAGWSRARSCWSAARSACPGRRARCRASVRRPGSPRSTRGWRIAACCIGGLELEGLNARLVTGGAAEALVTEGSFAWRRQAVRFSGQLGRAGFDGIAPLDLGLALAQRDAARRAAC